MHLAVIPVPPETLILIGQVVAYWGDFEVKLNEIIRSALEVLQRDEPNWPRRAFRKRKELFLTLAEEVWQGAPEIVAEVKAHMGTAADLHWRRNAVTHGFYAFTYPPHSSGETTIRAEGHHKKRAVTVPIDVPTLEKLWHDIAHLTGNFTETLRKVINLPAAWQTLPDRYLLEVYRETNHPWKPNPDKRTPPPPPPPA